MSRAAGTLITTNRADYVAPHFMPSYCGHCPTIKFSFAQTYGNMTGKYFQDFRSHALSTSSESNYSRGGHYPAYNSFNPDQAINFRFRCWDTCLVSPKYPMLNSDSCARKSLERFYQSGQIHRSYYNKTGAIYPVQYFQLPIPNKALFESKTSFYNTVHANANRKSKVFPDIENN